MGFFDRRFARDHSPEDQPGKFASRIQISGTFPNIEVLVDDRPIEGLTGVSLNLSANDLPTVSLDIMVTDMDIKVDPTIVDGWAHFVQKDGEEGMLRFDCMVVPEEPDDDTA